MNPVEIEEAVSALALEPFDPAEFPFQFLTAFGNKNTTIQRLRSGSTNASDVTGGVLQRNNIHLAACALGEVEATLATLRDSPKTATAKAKFVLATDGDSFQAEDLSGGGTVACAYSEFPDHFGFFLPLAGITTVEQIRESSFDIKATGRLNRLYVELLKDNPDWAKAERRPDMNHFMARLIFCFFAEDTDIFLGEGLFTKTVEQMSARDSSDTHAVISELFRAMDTKIVNREAAKIPRYANQFPYVNGQLFSGSVEVPQFSKIARSYLNHIGSLDWQKINPDIFGSMIQAVADDEERGALGMHYTSVPNILKVLNPLFLDDLRAKLEDAGDNSRKLLNLRSRMARIRVFDPACGSGNFLVIAYKEMRAIEAEINKRRGEPDRRTEIPLTNFRGIELRDFPAEIARLALIIAEYQCDVLYRGQKEALAEFLPLNSDNWITCGNALRLDWLSICPPTGTGVKVRGDDLFKTPLDQSEIDFENAGGETYICGNPPYKGRNKKDNDQKDDLARLLGARTQKHKSLDYVAGWLIKLSDYMAAVSKSSGALVATNSICQGEQVPILWPIIFSAGNSILFAHRSFKWANLASQNAGVTVIVVGLSRTADFDRYIFEDGQRQRVDVIGPYLVQGTTQVIEPRQRPMGEQPQMFLGNMAKDGGHLIFEQREKDWLLHENAVPQQFVRDFWGAYEMMRGVPRCCLWLLEADLDEVEKNPFLAQQIDKVKRFRLESKAPSTQQKAKISHRFVQLSPANGQIAIVVPAITSENRDYLPATLTQDKAVIGHKCYAIYDAPLWNLSLIVSRLHWVWIGTVCVRMRTDFSYSNTLGWNTFPLPKLTEQNKADLTRCAENILLAREAHFPATIADLYDPEAMPADLRRAHEENDEVLERIYIGRRFRNDTERLEKLFELYTKMTAKGKAA
ncbi:class I SAM-dependent DNA methyltransferase [Novosphingobium sp. MBES04]|uniref:class I SAM-dependent DNA methyltransferase n=1 Tax=Novosphingobium sp. MBES04 TaxID=1206458 RepID=UPI00057D4D7C|nr:DNA methyltransferase [Novosphingobium sp. MBES04]